MYVYNIMLVSSTREREREREKEECVMRLGMRTAKYKCVLEKKKNLGNRGLRVQRNNVLIFRRRPLFLFRAHV